MSDYEGSEHNTTTTSQAVDIKTSWFQEIYSSNNRTNARGNFELRSVPMPKGQNNSNNTTKEDNKNITLSLQSSSCCDVNQKAINIKKSILAKTYYCSMSSKDFEFTMANSAVEAVQHHRQYKLDGKLRPLSQGGTTISPQVAEQTAIDGRSNAKDAGREQIGAGRNLSIRGNSNLGIANQKILIFGGIDPYTQQRSTNDSHGRDVLFYDACENAWQYLSNMPGSRHHHSAIAYRGKIYVIGGTRPAVAASIKSVFESSVWSFDPRGLEWHIESTLPQPRRDFGLIAYDNDATNNNGIGEADGHGDRRRQPMSGLYIIGGESIDGTPLSSTLHYDVDRKLWSEKASLNIGRYGLVATVVNIKNVSKIWIAGGVCGQKKGGVPVITDTMEYYNLTDDDGCWKQAVKRLRIPRLFARFCTTGGGTALYVIGGIGLDTQHPGEFLSLSSVDGYDFREGRWIHLADMNMSRHGHDVVTVNEKILILGGVSAAEKKTLKSVECFCTRTSSCSYAIASLPSGLSGLAAVVVDCDM